MAVHAVRAGEGSCHFSSRICACMQAGDTEHASKGKRAKFTGGRPRPRRPRKEKVEGRDRLDGMSMLVIFK